MDKIDELTQILKRLNEGEDPLIVKREAQDLLSSINSKDLSFAEQKLIEAGLKPEDLRHLCTIHLEMLGDELEKMRAKIEPGHVIHTLVSEHDEILGFLDELERVNTSIQKMEKYEDNKEFSRLSHIAKHLLEADSHHEREEEILFPEIEKKGIFGPPQIMRMEHEDLRKRKKELNRITENVEVMDFKKFQKELDSLSKFIILHLRDHILKENSIVYPTALELIKDDSLWDKMKLESDKIGYCCFTPES